MATVKQSLFWCFTINNPTEEDDPRLWPGVQFLAFQLEKGESGTPHYQGYVVFSKRIRLSGLKKINPRANWGARIATHEKALHYVTKPHPNCQCEHCLKCTPESRLDGPWVQGEPPLPTEPGKRNDVLALKESLDSGMSMPEIADKHFPLFLRYNRSIQEYYHLKEPKRNFRTMVTISYGVPGTGKTRRLHELFPNAYWKAHGGKWWDDYHGEEHVIIDDFYGWIAFSKMLKLLDRYPLRVETKCGRVQFRSKFIHFTSNRPWEQWWKCIRNNSTWQRAFDRRVDLILRYTDINEPPIIEKCSEEGDFLQYLFVPDNTVVPNLSSSSSSSSSSSGPSTPFTSPVEPPVPLDEDPTYHDY